MSINIADKIRGGEFPRILGRAREVRIQLGQRLHAIFSRQRSVQAGQLLPVIGPAIGDEQTRGQRTITVTVRPILVEMSTRSIEFVIYEIKANRFLKDLRNKSELYMAH